VFEIRILASAVRELERLDKSQGQRLVERIRWLADNLEDIKPEALKGGLAGLFKLRTGDYRIIYEIIRDEKIIVIHQIGHRSEIYRKR